MTIDANRTVSEAVAEHLGEQSYLPAKISEIPDFRAHRWVLTAIEKAYQDGLNAGWQEATSRQ